MRCHGNGNSALTCSTMTWLRWFLRLAMKPTCIQPQRLAVSTAALACTEAQNVTYPQASRSFSMSSKSTASHS